MRERCMEKKVVLWAAGMLVVIGLAVFHFGDVRAGALVSGDTWLMGWYGILAVLVIFALALAGYLFCYRVNWRIEKVYLYSVLILGGLYLAVLAPLSAPDEVRHYISAYRLSNLMLGQQAMDEQGRVLIRQEDAFIEDVYGALESGETDPEKRVILGSILKEETYREIDRRGLWGGGREDRTASHIQVVETSLAAYVPQAVGITLARLFRMNGIGLLYMGRLCNLLFFAAVTYFAMRRLPFGKEVLFGTAMIPMTLNLVGSMSYDVMVIGLSFFFLSYCLWLAFGAERVRKRDVAMLAICAVVLMPCKMVYVSLLGLCFLIPVRKFGGYRPYLISAAVVLGLFLASMLLVNSQVIHSYATETESFVSWAGEAGYSTTEVLSNPGKLVSLFYNTIVWQGQHYVLTMMGAYLGNLDVILDVPFVIISLLSVALLGLSFRKPGENPVFSKGQWWWIWILILSAVVLILFSMLVTWTPVSSKIICGVQGRYFLPILPLVLMMLRNDLVVLTKNTDRTLLFLMYCANSYVILRLFGIVCLRL